MSHVSEHANRQIGHAWRKLGIRLRELTPPVGSSFACPGGILIPAIGASRVKAVYTELHRSHDPQFFLVRGVVRRTTEQPERADRLLAGLKAGKHDLVAPTLFGQGPRARVHSAEYLRFLEEAWEAWSALGDAGPEMIANVHPVRHAATYPTHIVGRLGWHTADTGCPIGPGTWAAACAATDVATTAAQLVMDGEDAAYALCRPAIMRFAMSPADSAF
jgi:acetoin utilization deacetylase AcuC-like enzyme